MWGVRRCRSLCVLLAAAAVVGPGRPAARGVELKQYDSKYYTLYTDLDPDAVRETLARMTRMADEYHERTRSFTGQIRHRFPFYLFRYAADYYAAGGIKRSGGVFMPDGLGGGKLMAIAGPHLSAQTWHIVQHEGFHQFARGAIGGDIPTWMNEGLAEYFGESIFTGDGFVTGVVPPWRLSRLKGEISGGQLKPIRALMALDGQTWNAEMASANYDQAWSMVHFLVHADNGRYAPAFSRCIREISNGQASEAAWRDSIGSTQGFEDRWKAYWLGQPRSPTHELYARATVAELTSFLARATATRQTFPDLAGYVAAADDDRLRQNPEDWLPHSLLADALRSAGLDRGTADDAAADKSAAAAWALGPGANHLPTLTYTEADGTRLTGWFTLNGSRVGSVNVEVDDLDKVLAEATPLRDAGKKSAARAMVQAALGQCPRSPAVADARAFLKTCR